MEREEEGAGSGRGVGRCAPVACLWRWLASAGCVHSLDRYRLTHPRPPTPEARSCATLVVSRYRLAKGAGSRFRCERWSSAKGGVRVIIVCGRLHRV